MSFSLYKPHVVNAKNDITTPDLLVDRITIIEAGAVYALPVQRMSSRFELQTAGEKIIVTPGFAITASGAGSLIGPVVAIRGQGHPPVCMDLCVARGAWRYAHIADHAGELRLSAEAGNIALADVAEPADVIGRCGGDAGNLPRGIVAVALATQLANELAMPVEFRATLDDDALDRSLEQRLSLVDAGSERWTERPMPRYTVGPVGEVEHYV